LRKNKNQIKNRLYIAIINWELHTSAEAAVYNYFKVKFEMIDKIRHLRISSISF